MTPLYAAVFLSCLSHLGHSHSVLILVPGRLESLSYGYGLRTRNPSSWLAQVSVPIGKICHYPFLIVLGSWPVPTRCSTANVAPALCAMLFMRSLVTDVVVQQA